jgi:hypothetical protein
MADAMRRLQLPVGFSALLLTVLVSSSPGFAGSLSPNIWYEFGFDPGHAPTVAGCQPDDPSGVACRPGIGTVNLDSAPWTFTLPMAADFTITDGFLAGDSFDVLDFGVLVGSTPSVPLSGHSCGFDPNICLVDPAMSHASFVLAAGPHSITISVNPAQILGEGFFEVRAPEPSTLLLVMASLVWMWRRKRFGLHPSGLNPALRSRR